MLTEIIWYESLYQVEQFLYPQSTFLLKLDKFTAHVNHPASLLKENILKTSIPPSWYDFVLTATVVRLYAHIDALLTDAYLIASF